VVGIPGRVVIKDHVKIKKKIDLDQIHLPDPIMQELECLRKRIIKLEQELQYEKGSGNNEDL
jgi:serine O-acetyltransferase